MLRGTLPIGMLHAAHVPFKPFLEHMVRTFGADRMTWGSDVGNTPGSMFMWVQHALASIAGLTLEQQEDLSYNAADPRPRRPRPVRKRQPGLQI